ncbi:CpsD/CapB family tyrosine-protein kinase [Clostridium psychrophilum]|uniref:CpsD/CapB family tyrosine-protein kinase n=1 Tax=Clostridium psychrophilum TaxID=132926 RepID=UPI001C0CB65A|nr:CpsD/CapB family tyrosine-protein kinase [Clostridium psychrophilum]MBU3180288.1 CpsD/CapB family tyrosine-protein kinase [Clostridium psychrophilum]
MLRSVSKIKNLKFKVVEQFRGLRTNIEFSSLGYEVKSIVVTSSKPFEGKSTIVSNLAVTMTSSGKRVVIVDCNFRRPTIHTMFSLSNSKGLTNILLQGRKIEDTVIKTCIPNLYVIPSGPLNPNSSELLGSIKMKEILNELTNDFDMVLIDAPSVLYISDAQILSALAQGTIIVTAYGKLDKNELLSSKEKIENVGGKILGVVINKIPNINNSNHGDCYKQKIEK